MKEIYFRFTQYMADSDYIYPWGLLTGLVIFAGVWIYSISEWGLLFGLLFGWLPATIGGVVACFLWPVIVFLIAALILFFVVGM